MMLAKYIAPIWFLVLLAIFFAWNTLMLGVAVVETRYRLWPGLAYLFFELCMLIGFYRQWRLRQRLKSLE